MSKSRQATCALSAAFLSCALVAALFATEQAKSEEAKARLSGLMWSAFRCSAYAENAGKKEEQQRLFDAGYKAGQEFIAAVESGQISKEDFSKRVPMYVTMLLSGPSKEFVLGRIFQFAQGLAVDQIMKEDALGRPLEMEDWRLDDDAAKIRAGTLYAKGNCHVIR